MDAGRGDNTLGGIGIIRTSRGRYLSGWWKVSEQVLGGIDTKVRRHCITYNKENTSHFLHFSH